MKKTLILIATAIMTLAATSCKLGCGCPGNAGYGNVEIQTENSQAENA